MRSVAGLYLLVAAGSAAGGVCRFFLSTMIDQRFSSGFPWGTIFVNCLGSFVIGVMAALPDNQNVFLLSLPGRTLVMVGVLGGFTTFSSFSIQTFALMRQEHWMLAFGNVILSLLLCLGGVALGFWCAYQGKN